MQIRTITQPAAPGPSPGSQPLAPRLVLAGFSRASPRSDGATGAGR